MEADGYASLLRGLRRSFVQHLPPTSPTWKLLLKLGAEPTATTSKRQNALMMAAGIDEGPNADGPGTAEEHFAAVNYLIELNKHDLDATDANGQSIMHAAAYKSLPNVIELFDQLGANIDVWNRKNKQGQNTAGNRSRQQTR